MQTRTRKPGVRFPRWAGKQKAGSTKAKKRQTQKSCREISNARFYTK